MQPSAWAQLTPGTLSEGGASDRFLRCVRGSDSSYWRRPPGFRARLHESTDLPKMGEDWYTFSRVWSAG